MVAGEAEDDEVFVFGRDFLVERFERGVLGREAAFGGGVDDEDDFVFEGGEVVGLAFFCRVVLVVFFFLGGGRKVGRVRGRVYRGSGGRWTDVLSLGLKS